MSVYRVAGLPKGLSKASTKEILDELFGTETQTLVRSLGLCPRADYLVAIVVFFPVPGPLLEGHFWKFDKVLSCESQMRRVQVEIDTAFFGFTPLNVVEDTQDCRIDCVIVSGLGSHPFRSWKDKDSQFMWLVDDDTAFPPNVRVLLYGYETSLSESESFQNLTEIGEQLALSVRSVRPSFNVSTQFETRPIAFIAHSLGGLVVKEAISSLAKNDASNAKCICGFAFFGVPHQGLLVKPWLRLIKEQPNQQLVENLKPESLYLKRLDKNFKDAINFKDLKVVSIYQATDTQTMQRDSRGAVGRTRDGELLIPITSALGHWPKSVSPGSVAINRNHDSLPKFRGRFDEDYQTVKHCLQDIWATAVEDVQRRFAADKNSTVSNIPLVEERLREALSETDAPVGLIPLWPDPEIEDATNMPTDVDLIAIHGVGGHAIKTWTCGDRFWLRDFLPSDFPSARVLTFGFDGSLVFNASKSCLVNIATQLLIGIQQLRSSNTEATERKRIFICHGIGGLVFKQAMIMACERGSRYSGLGKSVAGVIFLGTPHKKADIGYWSDLLDRTARICGLQHNPLFNLEERAIELGSICSGFVERGMPAGLQVFSLFEQDVTEKLGCLVVDRSSAILHLFTETSLPLSADHDNMSRYLTRSSVNYSTVFNCIAELVDTVSGKPEHTFFNSLQLSFISNLGTKDTERVLSLIPVHLNKSSKWLLEHPDFRSWTRQQGPQIIWLHGPPGSGKTILMRGVVAYLMEQSESSEENVIRKPLYFFFDDKDSARKTSEDFVRSVLSQILVDERTSCLVKYLEGRNYRKDAEVEDNLWICLSTVIQRSRGIVFQFVIDAIDEVLRSSAGEKTTILKRLEKLITQDLSGRVKLIFSQREMPHNDSLKTGSAIIDVDNDFNWQNVQAFVRRQIRQRIERSQISATTGDVAEKRIMEISRGNFLHARLAWHQFSKGITNWSRHQIHKSLDQLTAISHGLVAAYCKLLSSIPRAHRNKARASFAILRVSKEKLTSRQLAFFATLYAQKVDKRPSLLSELQSQSDEFESYLAEACGYLIRRAADGLVDFNHISVKNLFTDSMEGLAPEEQQVISIFEVSEAGAHAMMHTLCMSIFQLEDRQEDCWHDVLNDVRQAQAKLRRSFTTSWIFRKQADEVADLGATQIQSFARTPCFTYALRYFISHYEAAMPSSHIDSALVSFMHTRQAYYCHSMWLEIRKKDKDCNLIRTTPMHMECEEQSTSSNLSKSAAMFRVMMQGDCPRIVNGLAAQGANINYAADSNHDRVTPLSWAIICRRKDSFSALLRNEEVLINYSPDGTRAPLHYAARCVDDVFYIQRLTDHPYINVNVLHSSDTPLHVALDSKNRSGVDALLAHPDIDLGMRDSRLRTPYLKAFEHAMWEPFLLKIMTMVPLGTFSIPIPGTSQLLDAGRHGWTDVEEILLKAFPDQILTQDPETKMHVLAHYAFFGHREKLLWIMDRLPTQRVSLRSTVDHYDLLHLCANQNWEDIVHMLQRKHRLQSLSSDHMGRTLLHWALEYNWDIYKMDLSQYSVADLNKKDRDGLTAVHIAVTNRNMIALEILVASGASCLQKDNAGMSPAHMAADQGYRAALEYFIDINCADFGITRTGVSLLHLIALWVDGAMIRRFVTSRKPAINIHSVDHEHRTALHYAAKANNVSAVEALVTLGCNINGRDSNGKSPIHEAIRGGGADTALRLLHLGADWRATDDFGQTCLHLSLRYNSESLVPRFLRLGMDIGAVDWFGMTPLHRACGAGNVDHVRELLHQGAAWDARKLCGRSPLELAVEARAKSTVEIVLSWVLTLPEAQINGSRDRVKRYFDSALKLACELELDSTRIGKMLKEAGADIDYSRVKVKRVYLLGPTAEKRNPIVPLGNGLHNPFDRFNSGSSG